MTPAQRAAETVKIAAVAGVPGAKKAAARWRALIAVTVRDALLEARSGVPIASLSGMKTLASSDLIQCFVCAGSGRLNSGDGVSIVPCYGCNGRGVIVDTGAPPAHGA